MMELVEGYAENNVTCKGKKKGKREGDNMMTAYGISAEPCTFPYGCRPFHSSDKPKAL